MSHITRKNKRILSHSHIVVCIVHKYDRSVVLAFKGTSMARNPLPTCCHVTVHSLTSLHDISHETSAHQRSTPEHSNTFSSQGDQGDQQMMRTTTLDWTVIFLSELLEYINIINDRSTKLSINEALGKLQSDKQYTVYM